ncbi:MAG: V-type ATP synthase subunit A [Promethearchaeota archaeon]|nr:MAG: V-type ATP synthase subunit A [Candidatus Lokiarchaeota archaeon]
MIRENKTKEGYISAINGSLIKIKGLEKYVRLNDLIKIPNYHILGEIIQIFSDQVIAQCFDPLTNISLNERVVSLNEPLSMELAPGILGNVFDGIQRPLEQLFQSFPTGGLERGFKFPCLSRTKKWHFIPIRKINEEINEGDIIGTVQETTDINHKIMIPPFISGILSYIAPEGDYIITDEIFTVKRYDKEQSFSMLQKWPITKSRPYNRKENPNEPLITGIRAIDLLFPIVKGGTTAIPGGFGTGKSVIQQILAKWCNADIIVYIGCGEPGNEIANIMKQFSETLVSKSHKSLLERVVFIVNTSNMPVSAREASLFSGVTIAEYFRDMGYDVAVLADSTSRWAESLREVSGLLEEMPAEEGYPAYLPSKLSSFYERAGLIRALGKDHLGNERKGSISIVGTISPPAGDFSEPVTATTKRLVQVFWALDPNLAYLKHYPAINWLNSYSNYPQFITDWWFERDIDWPEIDLDWSECRNQVNEILSKEKDLKHLIQLIGEKNLPDDQQLILFSAKMIKNGFLLQNAFDEIEAYTNYKKLLGIIKILLLIYKEGKNLIEQGLMVEDILGQDLINSILRIGQTVPNDAFERIEKIKSKLIQKLRILAL